jgi:hypothetical protein
MNYLRLELKICEGCGVLWLRTGSIDGAYCVNCCAHLSSFPAPVGRHAGGRPRRSNPSRRTRASMAARRCNGGLQ